MFYRKNLYGWEQAMRVAAGLGLAAFALIAMSGSTWGYALAGGGAVLALTGVLGFCPMCAMAGRRPVSGSTTT